MKTKTQITHCLLLAFGTFSCSDNSNPVEEVVILPPAVENNQEQESKVDDNFEFPIVYVEELDQMQEYFKEQHETSFSHVPNKNWMSFTAGKDGILTKILLFGKPNYLISEHYGKQMSGFVRSGNPNTGAKFGSWTLQRDDIVNQLYNQGLDETEAGWITIRMKGKIPQEAGKTYFFVCEKISDDRPWLGAFAFGEGNPYLSGRHWLHDEHDLVFRTYVGKTKDQIKREQEQAFVNEPISKKMMKNSSLKTIVQPPPPKPMLASDDLQLSNSGDNNFKEGGQELFQGEPIPSLVLENNPSDSQEADPPQSKPLEPKEPEKSFFNRLFKKTSEQ